MNGNRPNYYRNDSQDSTLEALSRTIADLEARILNHQNSGRQPLYPQSPQAMPQNHHNSLADEIRARQMSLDNSQITGSPMVNGSMGQSNQGSYLSQQPNAQNPINAERSFAGNGVQSQQYSPPPRNHAQAQPAYAPPPHHPNQQMGNNSQNLGVNTSQLNGLLTDLRRGLQQDMHSTLTGELHKLQSEVRDIRNTAMVANVPPEIGVDLEQIAQSLKNLEGGLNNGDAHEIASLRLEIDSLRGLVDTMARQETVASLEHRWGTIEQTLQNFNPDAIKGDLADFAVRIDDIRHALAMMPQTRSIEVLEQKVENIAQTINSLVEHANTSNNGAELAAHCQRIDARLIELADQIGAIPIQNNDELSHRIADISARMNELSHQDSFAQLEERMARLQASLEVNDTADQSREFFPQIDQRLNELHHKMDALDERSTSVQTAGIERMVGQLAEIAHQLDYRSKPMHDEGVERLENRLQSLVEQIDQKPIAYEPQAIELPGIDRLEHRLQSIAERLDQPPTVTVPQHIELPGVERLEAQLSHIASKLDDAATNVGGINTQHLERQIAELSNQINGSDAGAVSEKLNALQDHLNSNDEYVLEAARQAAESTLSTYLQNQPNSGADNSQNSVVMSQLAEDIKKLGALYHTSDQRSAQALEALQNTMLSIADRIGQVNTEPRTSEQRAPNSGLSEPSHHTRMPIAAQLSDQAPHNDANFSPASPQMDVRNQVELGDVAQRMRQGSFEDSTSLTQMPAEDVPALAAIEELDGMADQPLEPGSGAPDIDSIMQKVRDVQKARAAQPKEEAPNIKAPDGEPVDFIASARRAAMAAAAEVEMMGNDAKDSKKKPKKVKDKAKKTESQSGKPLIRKPILMALGAVLLAVVTIPLVGSLFGSSEETTVPAKPEITMNEPVASDLNQLPVINDEIASGDIRIITDTASEKVELTSSNEQIAIEPSVDGQPNAELDELSANEIPLPAPNLPNTNNSSEYAVAENLSDDLAPFALKQAALNGDPVALFEIGVRYTEGRGTPIQLDQAAIWYQHASNLSFAPAQYRLANLYEKGTGVERDITKARDLYQNAAGQGNASAMHNLGVLYASNGNLADMNKAASWFEKAANYGIRDSQVNIAILYARGDGVPRDLVQSYKWFALAANDGDADAAVKRDEVFNALNSEKAESAREIVANWQPKPLDPVANAVPIPDSWTGKGTNTASVPNVDMKKAIKNIQAILNNNGYDAGVPDGIIGNKTTDAIKEFQASIDLEPNGQITDQLVQELLKRNG